MRLGKMEGSLHITYLNLQLDIKTLLIKRNDLTQIRIIIIITIKMAVYNNNCNNDKVYQNLWAKGNRPTHPPQNKVFLKNSPHDELALSKDTQKEYELSY